MDEHQPYEHQPTGPDYYCVQPDTHHLAVPTITQPGWRHILHPPAPLPPFPPPPPTNCSGGSLSDFLATDCENSDFFDHSDFVWSDTCTGNAIYESEKPLGCWLTDNWDAMVAANGIPGESRLAIIAGPYSVNFTLNGLLCMNSWFDLLEDYPASPLSASFNVDGDYPDCDPDLAPDLVTMGGGPMLMVLAAKLNLLRDLVLQDGEKLMRRRVQPFRGHSRPRAGVGWELSSSVRKPALQSVLSDVLVLSHLHFSTTHAFADCIKKSPDLPGVGGDISNLYL
jgi:hypothetical protein